MLIRWGIYEINPEYRDRCVHHRFDARRGGRHTHHGRPHGIHLVEAPMARRRRYAAADKGHALFRFRTGQGGKPSLIRHVRRRRGYSLKRIPAPTPYVPDEGRLTTLPRAETEKGMSFVGGSIAAPSRHGGLHQMYPMRPPMVSVTAASAGIEAMMNTAIAIFRVNFIYPPSNQHNRMGRIYSIISSSM